MDVLRNNNADGYLVAYRYQNDALAAWGYGHTEVTVDPLASKASLAETIDAIAARHSGASIVILNVLPLGYPVVPS